ncbi:MAG: potassium channel protein [Marinilabiliales bacterium]|nr:MAG: potassium channel protein [Marinilabiliales bacterium]
MLKFINRTRLFRSMILGILFLALIVFIGILGYMLIEGYSFIDAFFMTLITMSTVGFSEVQPLSDIGKLFTSFLIIFSFGIFAYVVSTFTRYVIDGVFKNLYIDSKVKKRIAKLRNHVIVCGYGRNGCQALTGLIEHNEQVIIIESNAEIVENIREETDYLFIHGDATQDDILELAQIDKAKALITTLPIDSDNLFVVLTAKEKNPALKIISRASNDNSDIKLKRAGATNVIMPDKVGGQRMATLVVQPDIVEFVEFLLLQPSRDVSLEEVSCENIADYFVDRTIRELDVRNASGANIVGLRTESGEYVINPSPDVTLSSKDQLFVIGTPEQIKKLKNILHRNI